VSFSTSNGFGKRKEEFESPQSKPDESAKKLKINGNGNAHDGAAEDFGVEEMLKDFVNE
jgi:hypothetical protein